MVWGRRRPRKEVPGQFQALAPARRAAGAVPYGRAARGAGSREGLWGNPFCFSQLHACVHHSSPGVPDHLASPFTSVSVSASVLLFYKDAGCELRLLLFSHPVMPPQ